MLLKSYENLPDNLKCTDVLKYYEILSSKKFSLVLKRIFDIVLSSILIILASPFILIFAIIIKCDSKGPVFFRQVRVAQFGKPFRIFKFRTMVVNAEQLGAQVTSNNDSRVTKIGKVIRKFRIDEVPQLFNIFAGSMSFVGTRPEVPRYVECYTNEMKPTLLLPPGLTSLASIEFKDENEMLDASDNPDETYVDKILPEKMKYNIEYLNKFNIGYDMKIMFLTAYYVFFK